MKGKNLAALAAVLSAIMLCSCAGDGTVKEFLKQKQAAEAKSGVLYRTTFFVVNEGNDGLPYSQEKGGKYRFVYEDETGHKHALTDYVFDDVRPTYAVTETQYFAPALYEGKWGYLLLDTEAKDIDVLTWAIEPQYENAEIFTEQAAAVMLNGKYGLINENGEVLLPFVYDSIKYSSNYLLPALQNGEWYFINQQGEKIYGPFEEAESYDYGYAAVKKGGKWGYIDKNGMDATAFVYDEAYSLEDLDYGWVRTGDKWEKVKVRP